VRLCLLARPLLGHGFVLGASVAGVAAVAGGVRVLPMLLAANVPLGIGPSLARGVLASAFEVGLFVAPPIAGALVGGRAVERGEAAALAALGVRPIQVALSAWPGALALAACCAIASAVWGVEAAAPGLLVTRLFDDARAACVAAEAPAVVEVPLTGASWLCFPGEPPRAVLRPPMSADGRVRAALAARELRPSEDLRTLRAVDALLVLQGDNQRATLAADDATIRGLVPLGHASNLSPPARAALLSLTSLALGLAATFAVVAARVASRARAIAVGTAIAVASLAVFSTLERGPVPLFAYALVPIAGLAACTVSTLAALAASRRASRRSQEP
jgi:hypothetical protein